MSFGKYCPTQALHKPSSLWIEEHSTSMHMTIVWESIITLHFGRKLSRFWAPETNLSWREAFHSTYFCTSKTHSPYFLLLESWESSGVHWILQPPLGTLEIREGIGHSLKSQMWWSLWILPNLEHSVILSAGKDIQSKNLNHIKYINPTSSVQQFLSST